MLEPISYKKSDDLKDREGSATPSRNRKNASAGGSATPSRERKQSTFMSLSWAATQLPKHRLGQNNRGLSRGSLDNLNNGKLNNTGLTRGISLIQAARDGLLEVVQSHLEASTQASIQDVDEDGFTALHHAARYNRVKVMELLTASGADLNLKGGSDAIRPLHMACRYNSGSATQFLLGRGAEVNVKDNKGRTPLHYATRRGHDVITKMLLSAASCSVDVPDNDLTTPLIMAAIQGRPDICELLISRGADIMKRDINDATALMWACAEGHMKTAKVLIKSAQRPGKYLFQKFVKAEDNEGNTALHLAVQNGNVDLCQILLDHHADVNCQKHNFATPLHVAATTGNIDIARLLITRGADTNCRDIEQMTPIHKAALYNKVDLIKLLMNRGGDINAKDKKNMSPLHCACWKGQTEAVDYLLIHGAQIAEADSSLKTALHWAVQFGHFETLENLLKTRGGRSLLELTDKNDQTVLHYAAYMGNVSVLKTLIEAGAETDAKDQEERTPLHIAAQYDNVSCVEALMTVSGTHITNDDDVDGRTPLLLACLSGHYQVVQVLLSLGADVSKRDDEHCSALMLAAARGHTLVMKILLDNHAGVNDTDKMKNTALHYACSEGHTEAVQLLLDKKSNVTLKNTYEQSPLELATDNFHNDVAHIMLRHKSWRQSMSVRDAKGRTVFDRLIEKVPDAAMVLLDHCVERSSRDDSDTNLTMVFDYQYLDPGPEDLASEHNRYFALNTMLKYERDKLLSHPLCQSILSQKWVKFGRTTFYINLAVYIGYMVSLTMFVTSLDDHIRSRGARCATVENTATPAPPNCTGDVCILAKKVEEKEVPSLRYSKSTSAWAAVVLFFVCLFFIREFFKLVSQRLNYVMNFFHWIAWLLMIMTAIFIYPPSGLPCVSKWRAGWIAVFLAWINFIMYLRRIDFVGIYVIMFVTVLVSLLKAIVMYFLFVWAFSGSFYIMLAGNVKHDEHGEELANPYSNIWTAVLNIVIMTLGEIEYVDNFLPYEDLEPFGVDVNILLLVFLFLMPIVLMNLMIGIAVGDIEKVQHNAYLKRIALQVDLLYNMENNMPKFAQRKVHVKRAIVKPNERVISIFNKISPTLDKLLSQFKRYMFGSVKNVQFIEAEHKDKISDNMNKIQDELNHTQSRMKSLQLAVQQQNSLLQQIAAKLNVHEGGPIQDNTSTVGSTINQPDGVSQYSVYDNHAAEPHHRTRSVRVAVDMNDRPRSIVF